MSLKVDPENTWVTSDHHFWHSGILERRGINDDSGEGLARMHDSIIDTWNTEVPPNDLVIVLGDFSLAGLAKTEEIVEQLSGRLVIVRGNHDSERMLRRLAERNPGKVGFAGDYLELRASRETENPILANLWAACSHYPMLSWNGSSHGSMMLHGHRHQRLEYPEEIRQQILNVNWDVALAPINLASAWRVGSMFWRRKHGINREPNRGSHE